MTPITWARPVWAVEPAHHARQLRGAVLHQRHQARERQAIAGEHAHRPARLRRLRPPSSADRAPPRARQAARDARLTRRRAARGSPRCPGRPDPSLLYQAARNGFIVAGALLFAVGVGDMLAGHAKLARVPRAWSRGRRPPAPHDPAALFPKASEAQERHAVAQAKLAFYQLLFLVGQLLAALGVLLLGIGVVRQRRALRAAPPPASIDFRSLASTSAQIARAGYAVPAGSGAAVGCGGQRRRRAAPCACETARNGERRRRLSSCSPAASARARRLPGRATRRHSSRSPPGARSAAGDGRRARRRTGLERGLPITHGGAPSARAAGVAASAPGAGGARARGRMLDGRRRDARPERSRTTRARRRAAGARRSPRRSSARWRPASRTRSATRWSRCGPSSSCFPSACTTRSSAPSSASSRWPRSSASAAC